MDNAFYILEILKDQGKYRMALQLESNDNSTPVLCLLKSNALSISDKREYFIKLVQRYEIYPEELTIRELKNRNLEDIYKRYHTYTN